MQPHSTGSFLNLRIANQDQLINVPFTGSFNAVRFIDKVCMQHGICRDSARVLHKGRLLNDIAADKT